jgi:hypothetical protein
VFERPFQSSETIQPTAETQVILQVLPYCDTVSLYGFSWKNSKGEPESHYYSNERVSDLQWQVERRFTQLFAIQGLVNIST